MLPIVLVLLVAASAIAAPYVNLNQVSENAILGPRDNTVIARALNVIDGGEVDVYTLNAIENLKDLASAGPRGQVQAYGQAIALLGQLSTGRSGDSCAAAGLINAYASGNPGAIRGALGSYVRELSNNIDSIVNYNNNPGAARYASGSRGGCPGGGRTYEFDAAWDRVLASTPPNKAAVIDQEYCTAKRLYSSFGIRNNNVGAAITASALPPVGQIFSEAGGALSSFLKVLGSGGNPASAAAGLKQALRYGVGRVSL